MTCMPNMSLQGGWTHGSACRVVCTKGDSLYFNDGVDRGAVRPVAQNFVSYALRRKAGVECTWMPRLGHMRFVGDLVGRTWYVCHCTVGAGLRGEIGQLQQLERLSLPSNRLQGKYIFVCAVEKVGI